MIYIKRKSTSLLLALASLSVVSSSLVSCSESVGMTGITLSDKKISFTATEVNGWTPNSGNRGNDETTRTVGSYHPLIVKSDLGKPLYLHPVEQVGTYFYNDKDELVTRSGIPLSEIGNQNRISTRGSKVTEIGDEILVSSVSKKNNVEAGYFPFEKATKSGNIWHISSDKYWTTDATLSFYAYAPTNASMLSTSDSELSGYRTVHYLAGTGDDIKSQPDLIVASYEGSNPAPTDAASAVNLQFSHALTAVTFSVGSDMAPGYVKSVAIHNVKGEGDYDFSSKTGNPWTTNSTLSDYTIKLGTDANGILVTTGKSMALTYDPMTLMMIPQSFSDGKAEVELVFNDGVSDHHLFATLTNDWKPGYTVNYKLSSSDLNTLNIGSVVFPTNWSNQYTTTANKLKSSYANNDQIGLFVVDETGHLKHANIPVTYNSNTQTWSLPNDKEYLFYPMYHYFAYYPYQESLVGMPAEGSEITINGNDDKDKAVNFFNDAIENWKPVSDQSDLDKLNKCDLQIGMANLSSDASSIDFNTMSHAMSLAEVTLTTRNDCNCELYSDASYTWVGPVPASENFGANKMFKITNYEYTNNKFVSIVKPNTETEFSGGKNDYGVWSLSIPAIEPNAIGSGSSVLDKKQRFALELGDIYYSDGALTHQNEALASNKTSIGIVGYIAKGGDDYWVEKNTDGKGHGGHALVMCLLEPGAQAPAIGSYYWWGPAIDCGRTKVTTPEQIKTSGDKTYGSGFLETNALIAKLGMSYAAGGAKGYNTLVAPADKSTGWFLPTAGQFYAMFSQFSDNGELQPTNWQLFQFFDNSPAISTKISKALSKVGEHNYVPFFTQIDYNWTSTESTVTSGIGIGIDTGMDNGKASGTFRFSYNTYGADGTKNEQAPIRPFLAF